MTASPAIDLLVEPVLVAGTEVKLCELSPESLHRVLVSLPPQEPILNLGCLQLYATATYQRYLLDCTVGGCRLSLVPDQDLDFPEAVEIARELARRIQNPVAPVP